MKGRQKREILARTFKFLSLFAFFSIAYVLLDYIFNAPELPERTEVFELLDWSPNEAQIVRQNQLVILVVPSSKSQQWKVFQALGTDLGCPLELELGSGVKEVCSNARYDLSGEPLAQNDDLLSLRKLPFSWLEESNKLVVHY